MPYSSANFDLIIRAILGYIKPETVYDLGAGAGKYGSIVRQISPGCRIIGVETESEYINKFHLKDIYTELVNKSVMNLTTTEYYDTNFDTVIIGDVIEHILKSDGINLLNFLIYRTRWIIIQFPEKYLQNSVDGHYSEAHISIWNENDFLGFTDRTRVYGKGDQRLVVLKGYIETKIDVNELDTVINENEQKD